MFLVTSENIASFKYLQLSENDSKIFQNFTFTVVIFFELCNNKKKSNKINLSLMLSKNCELNKHFLYSPLLFLGKLKKGKDKSDFLQETRLQVWTEFFFFENKPNFCCEGYNKSVKLRFPTFFIEHNKKTLIKGVDIFLY